MTWTKVKIFKTPAATRERITIPFLFGHCLASPFEVEVPTTS